MKKIFSGIQPTGEIHIGNYLGAIRNWVELQKEYECVYCIVDYHAITTDYNPQKMQEQILNAAIDLLACGVDPKKSILFVQSQVPEHTELAWILNTLTPISELERMTQFKDKSQQHKQNINVGLFDYPILQAADILLYNINAVPVGEDQYQHIELTRKIAKKFNNKFGEHFLLPEIIQSPTPRVMSLAEPTKKMSKSLGPAHYIALSDSPEIIRKKISKAVTDTSPDKNMSAGVQNLFELLQEFADKEKIEKFRKDYNNQTIKYSELKQFLAKKIIETLDPIRKKKEKLKKDPKKIKKILEDNGKRAKKIAEENIREIRKIIGLR